MLPLLLLKGSLIGLTLSLPMGPTGMLCLRYSLLRGKAFGLASGLGIALAEGLCGCITAALFVTLTSFIENNLILLQFLGSLFLFYFGLFTLKSDRSTAQGEVVKSGYFLVFLRMFLLTFTNPITLISFVAIFTGMGIESFENDALAIGLLSVGVFLGSIAWWALVSSSSSYFANKLCSSFTKNLNKIVGIFIIGLSIFSFFAIFLSFIYT